MELIKCKPSCCNGLPTLSCRVHKHKTSVHFQFYKGSYYPEKFISVVIQLLGTTQSCHGSSVCLMDLFPRGFLARVEGLGFRV